MHKQLPIATSDIAPAHHYTGLEALRAVAALMVVVGHILYYPNVLDPGFTLELAGKWMPPTHVAVLVFFTLSGYVIGLTNRVPLRTREAILGYLKKRLVRLYPIYLVAVLATICVGHMGIRQILGHLVFGQGLLVVNTWENNPLWSLHFEVLYYLAFIPLSYFRISAIQASLGAVALGVLCVLLLPWLPVPILSSYLFGFCFWAAGWALAARDAGTRPFRAHHMVAACLLMLTLGTVQITAVPPEGMIPLFTLPESTPWIERAIPVYDLKLLPWCIWLVAMGAGKLSGHRWITVLAYGLPLVAIGWQLLHTPEPFSYAIPIGLWISAVLVYLLPHTEQLAKRGLRELAKIGSISYALYALHFPLLIAFQKYPSFSGSETTFYLRLLLFAGILAAVAYFLERVLQPRIKRWFS